MIGGPAPNPFQMFAPNSTSTTKVGGATGPGRPSSLALATNGSDLYVGYTKSQDVVRLAGVLGGGQPAATTIARTNDSKGTLSFAMLGNDLFMSEGSGLTKLVDPAGNTAGLPGGRVACPVPAPGVSASCKGASTGIESSPGGLAAIGPAAGPFGVSTPGLVFYGHAPVNRSAGFVSAWNPAAPTSASNPFLISSAINPVYNEIGGGALGNPAISHSTYVGPLAIGTNGVTGPGGAMIVGDDPYYGFTTVPIPTAQGHYWSIPAAQIPPTVASVVPNTTPVGTPLAGIVVTGTGFDPAGSLVTFSGVPAGGIPCTPTPVGSTTVCTLAAPSPAFVGGIVDVRVTAFSQTSPIAQPADVFTYTAAVGPVLTTTNNLTPLGVPIPGAATGVDTGGTLIGLTGLNFTAGGLLPTVTFGSAVGTVVACPAPTNCTVLTPPGVGGTTVPVQVTLGGAASSPTNTPGVDTFTYVTPTANLYAWGITAPKGGVVFLPQIPAGAPAPGTTNGNGSWWSPDHASGFCRQNGVPAAVVPPTPTSIGLPIADPGNSIFAIDYSNCDQGDVGSPGQPVWDGGPRRSSMQRALQRRTPWSSPQSAVS